MTTPETTTVSMTGPLSDDQAKAITQIVEDKGLQFPSRSKIRKAQREVAKLSAKYLAETHTLQFCHIRNYFDAPYVGTSQEEVSPKGGMTLAYRVSPHGGNVVEIATAVCNPKDIYDKVHGKYYAAHNFSIGKTVQVRLSQDGKWGQQLKQMFEYGCTKMV